MFGYNRVHISIIFKCKQTGFPNTVGLIYQSNIERVQIYMHKSIYDRAHMCFMKHSYAANPIARKIVRL